MSFIYELLNHLAHDTCEPQSSRPLFFFKPDHGPFTIGVLWRVQIDRSMLCMSSILMIYLSSANLANCARVPSQKELALRSPLAFFPQPINLFYDLIPSFLWFQKKFLISFFFSFCLLEQINKNFIG